MENRPGLLLNHFGEVGHPWKPVDLAYGIKCRMTRQVSADTQIAMNTLIGVRFGHDRAHLIGRETGQATRPT